MSSSESGTGGTADPRGHEGAPEPPLDAPVESAPADVDSGRAAADRGAVPAPGAPGELTSDEDRPGQSPDGVGGEVGADPDVTVTSGPAADDVPVLDEAVGGDARPQAPEGGDTAAEDATPPASTAADDPGALTPDEPPEPATATASDATVSAGAADVAPPGRTAAGEVIPDDASAGATTTTDAAVAAPEPELVAVDEERQPLLDLLAEHLGDGLVATHVIPGRDMWVRVTREAWVRAAEVCRDVLGMRYFGFLSAMDWMPSPYGRSEDGGLAGAGVDAAAVPVDPARFEPGVTGGDTRFQLIARLQAPVAPTFGITLKCDVPDDDLVMPTWSRVFPGADWHERECAEMFGIGFAGHPNLVKLYLPGAFEGYPLRKDFPLLARDVKPWPGLVDVEAMPGEDADDSEGATATAGAGEA